ncbi:MAG TPA: glycosyltransferase, partial [Rhodothermales bacterium]|nr:glycosyltransferase [Rhodothermales bacterium]
NEEYINFLGSYFEKVFLVDNFPLIMHDENKNIKCHKQENVIRLLYAGVLGKQRGLEFLVSLTMEIKRRKLPWKMVWAGMCINQTEREAADEQIKDVVEEGILELHGWHTYLPYDKISVEVDQAFVGLCLMEPHAWWPIPTKFYEYATSGLPLICTDTPVWRDWVEAHSLGAVVPYGDPEAVIRLVQEWLDDPNKYANISEKAEKAGKQFTWSTAGAVLLAAYRRLEGEISSLSNGQ